MNPKSQARDHKTSNFLLKAEARTNSKRGSRFCAVAAVAFTLGPSCSPLGAPSSLVDLAPSRAGRGTQTTRPSNQPTSSLSSFSKPVHIHLIGGNSQFVTVNWLPGQILENVENVSVMPDKSLIWRVWGLKNFFFPFIL